MPSISNIIVEGWKLFSHFWGRVENFSSHDSHPTRRRWTVDRVYITIINPRGWDRLGFIIVTQLRSTVQPLTSTIDDEKGRGG